MGWADNYVKQVQSGQTISFRPRGNSMRPHIESGQLVTVEPLGEHVVTVGDIVFCRVKGHQYLHFVSAVRDGQNSNPRYRISNARGHENGWIGRDQIYGRVVVES